MSKPNEANEIPSKAALWGGRVASALPALAMAMSGAMKVSHGAPVVEGFAKFGYPAGALTPIGIVELACVVLYLIPRTAVLGAILIAAYLGGAVATHVRAGEPFILPVLLGVLAWVGLWLRDPRVRALAPLRSPG